MSFMHSLFIWLLVPILVSGCQSGLYPQWGNALNQMADSPTSGGRGYTENDVSMLLGCPPVRREQIQDSSPALGFVPDPQETTKVRVAFVIPNSPASTAGLRPGDIIQHVNGVTVTSFNDWTTVVGQRAAGDTLALSTTRGEITVTFEHLPEEQIYWDISAGGVARSASGAYVDSYGGAAYGGGSAYQRFFRASCRFRKGILVMARSNWQE
jgi:hypothetical protein